MRRLIASAALLATALGCSSGGSGDVNVTLDEFSVKPDRTGVDAGSTVFEVRNTGSVEHDFLILETDRDAKDLPLGKGSKVDTGARGIDVIEHIHSIETGGKKSVTVDLETGPYLLICNVAGHYSGGMVADLEVE